MSLRLRILILFGGLLALLAGAEWWLVRSLTRQLSVEVGEVASSVGQRIVRFIGADHELPAVRIPPPEPGAADKPAHFFVYRTEMHKDAGAHVSRSETEVRVETTTGDVAGQRTSRVLRLRGPNVDTSIPIPEAGFGRTLAGFQRGLLLGSLGILAFGLAVAAFVADRVSSPLRELAQTARRVGEGSFGARVSARGTGEVREAIEAFNRMSSHLAELEREALSLKERQHLGELGDVARGLAHALRNPLHAIGLSLDELAERAEGTEAVELAASARRQIRRVDESIRSFLALAAGSSGAEEELDVGAVVEDVVLGALQDARGRVSISVEKAGAPRLRGIAAEVRAVVQALVVNAVEATPEGGAVRVGVAAGEDGSTLVTVDDDGAGIDPDVEARLFLPHVTTKANGSGMGLFLAQRIAATRYTGLVRLEARVPRGTRAALTLHDRERPVA